MKYNMDTKKHIKHFKLKKFVGILIKTQEQIIGKWL